MSDDKVKDFGQDKQPKIPEDKLENLLRESENKEFDRKYQEQGRIVKKAADIYRTEMRKLKGISQEREMEKNELAAFLKDLKDFK